MDVNGLTKTTVALFASCWFSLAALPAGLASELVISSDAELEDASLVIVGDADASPGSLDTHNADAAPSHNVRRRVETERDPTSGNRLTVIANASRTKAQKPSPDRGAPAELTKVDPSVRPATIELRQPLEIGRSVPATKPAAASTTYTPPSSPSAASVDPSTEELLAAHELSLSADGIEDLTKIVELCAPSIASASPAVHEQSKQFARRLSSWALNRRGQIHLDAPDEQSAQNDFETALQFDPSNWRALHNRGVSRAQAGDLAAAFDDFSQVIALNDQFAKAYANRAALYVRAGDQQHALDDYEQALRADPGLLAAHLGRGRVCHALGRLDEALVHFDAVIRDQGDNADALCSRGDVNADLGRYAAALTDYAHAIEVDPDLAHAYRNGSWLLATCPDARFRDGANAVQGAEQALNLEKGDRHAALDTLAAALACCGRFEEAVATLHQAVEAAPEGIRATYLARLGLYESRQSFLSQPFGEATHATFEQARESSADEVAHIEDAASQK